MFELPIDLEEWFDQNMNRASHRIWAIATLRPFGHCVSEALAVAL